jgi:hypothetical protein
MHFEIYCGQNTVEPDRPHTRWCLKHKAKAERKRFRFPLMSLEFFIYIKVLVSTEILTEMSSMKIPWGLKSDGA